MVSTKLEGASDPKTVEQSAENAATPWGKTTTMTNRPSLVAIFSTSDCPEQRLSFTLQRTWTIVWRRRVGGRVGQTWLHVSTFHYSVQVETF